jgi:hypothetical protein
MALKAKHAFGALERVDENIESGVIDSYDVLFVKDSEGKPYVGWVSKDGQKEIIDPYAEVAKLGTQVEAELATKADAEKVKAMETELANKVSAEEVKAEVEAAVEKTVEKTKYEIVDVPAGTLVDYRDKEIRIMCPESAVFEKQNVGAGGDPNNYYFTFKTFAPSDDAVGYIEHLGNQVDKEILTSFNVDKNGRRYQPTWLSLAAYDEATGVWNYYGKNSTANKYIGWDYQIDWYNADGVMVASDSVRINLSNESCHSIIEPYYVSKMMTEVETKIETMVDEKVAEVESAYEVIEF